MRFVGLSVFVLAAAVWAQEPNPVIENVCDTLIRSDVSTINLAMAYIDESNWYGNPHTMVMDSADHKRHDSYESLEIKNSAFNYKMPVSIEAACTKKSGVELTYAKWNSSKRFVEDVDFKEYSTYIIDTKFTEGNSDYSKKNAYNFFAFVPGSLPDDDSYKGGELLVSQTYEFEFSWWYVGLIYSEKKAVAEGIQTTNHYSSSIAYDSTTAFNSAFKSFVIPDTINSFRIQAVRVVLKDSRKLRPEAESSSSYEDVSSSSEEVVESSSSIEPEISSSSEEVEISSSSEDVEVSSSSEEIVSSSSEEPVVSSSSEEPAVSSSSYEDVSSSSEDVVESSSSIEPEVSSSSEDVEISSSSEEPEVSSSSEEIVSSSSEEPVVSSSSEEPVVSSSSYEDVSSSSEEPAVSSSSYEDVSSSSEDVVESSSSVESEVSSSSEDVEISSSSEEPEVSSSSVEVVIRNVCDTLGQTNDGMVVLALDFIDEVNWYGNPQTMEEDSVFVTRHESTDDLDILSNSFKHKIPLSVTAACRETSENDFVYAAWNDEQKLEKQKAEGAYSTRIFDMNQTSFGSYNSDNSNNVLVYVDGELPQNNSFSSNEIMVSKPYELEFEWWFIGLSYDETVKDGDDTRITTHFVSAVSIDSLSAYTVASKSLNIPESVETLHIQSVKAVLKDSRKLTEPEPASSADVAKSSSSEETKFSSSEKAESSSSEKAKSSSSKDEPDVSSSSEESEEDDSSTSTEEAKSSSSEKGKSSSSGKGKSSSSSKGEKSDLVYGLRTAGVLPQEVQVRNLDGTVVPADKKLVPGVYYVKMSDGTWKKKAVMPK